MDERCDIIRSVRNGRFLYISNYEPLKTFYQYKNTPEKGATMAELRLGKLPPAAEFYFSSAKPVEELYDYLSDSHNINNLASQPQYKEVLEELRTEHISWVKRSKDTGLIPEPILKEKAKTAGSEYAVLRQAGADSITERIANAAKMFLKASKRYPLFLKLPRTVTVLLITGVQPVLEISALHLLQIVRWAVL
ncbi:MAG: hypothetical protein MK132_19455 [Lentisphaerales bacterium]|nr:hypothetical protein [Lentisphaerales bacterium]